jgi:hypothetical protein
MEALRQIVDSEELQKIINLPDSFKNRKLELVVLPAGDEKTDEESPKRAKGFLNRYKNIELIKEEELAWEKAVLEKHGNS